MHVKQILVAWHTLSASRIVFMKHTICVWHTHSAVRVVFMKQILCLKHPCNKTYAVHETHIVCLKLFQQVVSCSWNTLFTWQTLSACHTCGVHEADILCLTHSFSNHMVSMNKKCISDTPFRKSGGVRAKDFVALLLTSFLLIACEQKGHQVTPCGNSKVIIFGFLTAMNVKLRSSGMWGRVVRYICADVSEVRCPHLQNLPICCSEQFVRNSYQCWCLFSRLHGNISFNDVTSSPVLIPNTLYRMPRPC